MARTDSIRRWLRLICLSVFGGLSLFAQSRETYLPLFTIERSINANVVHYDAKITPDGRLDSREPIVAYWVMAAEDGRRQPLNLLERTRAYGFFTRPEDPEDALGMFLVADRRREIQIRRQGGSVRAETTIGGCHAYLQRIFITTRKSLLITVPEVAEMFGVDVATGAPCSERVRP
jgi:Domain of unknown function (DUF4833)